MGFAADILARFFTILNVNARRIKPDPRPASLPSGANPHGSPFLQGIIGMGDDPFALGQAGTDFHLQPAALADLHDAAAGLAVLDRERGPALAQAEQCAGGR